MPRGYASQTGCGEGPGRHIPASLDGLLADTLAQQEIRVIEILEELGEECVTIGGDVFLDPFEDTAVYALRVVRRLQQEGWDRRDEHRLAHALRSVLADVTRHFAAPHRETCQREVPQFEVCHEFMQVLGEGVVVVAAGRLTRLAEAPAIVGNHTVTRGQQHRGLLLPGRTAQWISVDQDNRPTRAVVLIINFNVAGVFLSYRNVWHRIFL